MAARENQGLQIALIIFVILTIILTVTTFLFFNSLKDERIKNASLTSDNESKSKAAAAANDENRGFKQLIGAAETDPLEAVNRRAMGDKEKNIPGDFEKYGKNLPDTNQNYRSLTEQLFTDLTNANKRIAEITEENVKLAAQLKSDQEAKEKEIAEYTKTVAATAKDLKDVRDQFTQARAEMDKVKDSLSKRFESTRKDHEELTRQSSEEISGLKNDNSKLSTLLENINNNKLEEQAANAKADGKVTWVNQRSRTVWINLGTADGLRRQTTFSVFPVDESNPLEANRKGKIEVINLLDRHRAEARILDDNLGNPMMPGDLVYSPAWEPGRPEHFALAGLIDINGDGESDLQKVRDLITLNGGVIDAEVSDDGKYTGKMSIDTKYLVLGKDPPVTAVEDNDTAKAKLDSWTKIHTDAQTLGIRKIGVQEFLDYMGYKPEDRTVSLGKHARPDDFKPRLPQDVQRTMPLSPPREPRTPAARAAGQN